MKILVGGAGGFIAGYLVKDLLAQGHEVIAADIKPSEEWYQTFDAAENHLTVILGKSTIAIIYQKVLSESTILPATWVAWVSFKIIMLFVWNQF